MRKRRRALFIVLLLIGCGIVCVDCEADHLILGENHDVIDPGGARRELIHFEGRAVEYWVARSPKCEGREPTAYVLFFIGKGGRSDQWIEQIAQAWGEFPVEVWGMNYPGSGGSDGPVRVAQVGPDAVALFDSAKAIAGTRPIFVQAGSFGTTAALCVAARRPVAGLVLQNPPPLKQLILGNYGWWNLWLAAGPVAANVPADLDSIENGKQCTAPAVFILAQQDSLVPTSYHQLVVDAYAGPKRVITMPFAGHDSPLTHEAADDLAAGKDWMWKLANSHN
jgi:pimeloyl-ACP methyl ester carboxylesterase